MFCVGQDVLPEANYYIGSENAEFWFSKSPAKNKMSCYTTKTDTENFYSFSMLLFNFRLPSVILWLFKILLKYCCKYIDVLVIQVEFECSALENLFFIGFYSQIYLWTLMLLLIADSAYLRNVSHFRTNGTLKNFGLASWSTDQLSVLW